MFARGMRSRLTVAAMATAALSLALSGCTSSGSAKNSAAGPQGPGNAAANNAGPGKADPPPTSAAEISANVSHAKAVTVDVTQDALAVTVEVADDATTPPVRHHRDGYGLAGLRERVTALDGTLSAGPRAGGGWSVRARIPA